MTNLSTWRYRLKRFRRYWHLVRGTAPGIVIQVFMDKLSKAVVLKMQRVRVTLGIQTCLRKAQSKRLTTFREQVRFFGLNKPGHSKEEFLKTLSSVFPESMGELLHRAEEVMAHRFDLLGSGLVSLGKDIDWHRDFKSGRRWDPVYFGDIREVDLEDTSDIKVPWELSRCYHFVTLGKAFFRTNNERYAAEFVSQLEDWI